MADSASAASTSSADSASIQAVDSGVLRNPQYSAADRGRAAEDRDGRGRQRPDHGAPPAGAAIVTVSGSDDANTPGTYIGDTCAGAARNVPADVTLTK